MIQIKFLNGIRVVILVLILICSLGPSQEAWAKADSEIRSQIQMILKMRHPNDTRQMWQNLGPEAPKIMISMFQEDKNIYHQIRLVNSLAWFDGPKVVQFLKEQVEMHPNAIVQRAAMRSLGLSQGLNERDFLKRGLESPDPHMRLVTAQLLADLKDPAADQWVTDFLKTEKVGWIPTVIKKRSRFKQPTLVIKPSRKF